MKMLALQSNWARNWKKSVPLMTWNVCNENNNNKVDAERVDDN